MLEQRIQQQFFESADLKYQCAELLSRPVADAARTLLTAITAGGKVMICGSGWGSSLSTHLQALLVGRFERERPALAAIALALDGALAATSGPDDLYAMQVRALAQPGDVLVAIDAGGVDAALVAAVDAARHKDLSVIVLSDAAARAWPDRLSETDVLVAVPHERPARIVEIHLLVLHCLCDALDLQLLGEQDP